MNTSPGKMVPFLLRMLTHKSDTVLYPAVEAQVPDKFRGMLKFHGDRCVGCKLCVRMCPSNAITIEKVADKQFKAIVHLDKCLYCGQCVDSCNKGALENTQDFELASSDKNSLTREI